MRPLRKQSWLLPGDVDISALISVLEQSFSLKIGPIRRTKRVWQDSFDWRLYRAGLLLIREKDRWRLLDFQGRERAILSADRGDPVFAHEFPASSLRDRLSRHLGIRALIPLVREEVASRTIDLRNRDRKIVAQLVLESGGVAGRPQTRLLVREVRGYGRPFRQVEKILERAGAGRQQDWADLLARLLESSGRRPLDYSSGFRVDLTPETPAIEAVVRIYSSLLVTMRRNEQGVIDDIDSEFLHDLRVAVRRTRSGLSLIKGVLDPAVVDRYKRKFALIGRATGPVRDLDVYLLSESACRSLVPARLQVGMDHFFRDLARRREEEQHRLVRFLRGTEYRRILDGWQQVLEEEPVPAGPRAGTPIGELAGEIIARRLNRVLRDGGRITDASPDEKLHRLRIQGKKLRYCLEFFRTLYDEELMGELIGQLKKLQNNLGDFNDLSVQQQVLAADLDRLHPRSRKSLETGAALGGLMTALARQHERVRSRFGRTFARFSGPDNQELFRRLFGGEEAAGRKSKKKGQART